jgi:hypothetical protein
VVLIIRGNGELLNLLLNSGDNFFKSASYTIEIVCGESFSAEKEKLQNVEAKILTKRAELSKFEAEYREVCGRFSFYVFSIWFSRCIFSGEGLQCFNNIFCRFWQSSLK